MQKNILMGVVGVVIIVIVAYFLLGGDQVSSPVNGGNGENGGTEGVLSDVVKEYVDATAELDLVKIESITTEEVYDRIRDDIGLLQASNAQLEVKSFNVINENIEGDTGTVSYSLTMEITVDSETTDMSSDLTISLVKADGTWKISSIPQATT